jgi:hypothetical protein
MGSRRFVDDNDAPNNESPCKGGHPMKKGKREVSLSRLGWRLLHLSQLPSPLVCRPMQSTTANAFAADLILPADVSHVATDGDALVVRTNGNEETPNGNDAMADCVPCKLRAINSTKQDEHFSWV